MGTVFRLFVGLVALGLALVALGGIGLPLGTGLLQGSALGLLLGAVVAPPAWKRQTVAAMSNEDERAANLAEFPQLDASAFEELTQAWQKLGFEAVVPDHVRGETRPQTGLFFARFMQHPTEGALVEISQTTLPNNVARPVCSVFGYYGDAESLREQAKRVRDSLPQQSAPLASPNAFAIKRLPLGIGENELSVWSLSVSNRPDQRGTSGWRHARIVGQRLDPNASPRELWEAFRAQRRWLETRLEAPRVGGDLAGFAENFTLVMRALWRARLSRAWAIPFFYRALLRSPKERAFWGELGAPPEL